MSELEQFCILAKTLKGRACAALIEKVLNHRKIFVFGELLSEPSVQAVMCLLHRIYRLIYFEVERK
jgi:hypothetical protein